MKLEPANIQVLASREELANKLIRFHLSEASSAQGHGLLDVMPGDGFEVIINNVLFKRAVIDHVIRRNSLLICSVSPAGEEELVFVLAEKDDIWKPVASVLHITGKELSNLRMSALLTKFGF